MYGNHLYCIELIFVCTFIDELLFIFVHQEVLEEDEEWPIIRPQRLPLSSAHCETYLSHVWWGDVLYMYCTGLTVRPTCPMYGGVMSSTCTVLVSL